MIDVFATMLCLKRDLLEPEPRSEHPNNHNYNAGNQFSDDMKYVKVRLLDNGRESSSNHSRGNFGVTTSDIEHNNIHANVPEMQISSSLTEDIRVIREVLEQFRDKKAKAETKEKCLREWKVICCVTDRMFFLSYVIINITGIVVIFFGNVG